MNPVLRNLSRTKLTYPICKKILSKACEDPIVFRTVQMVDGYFQNEKKTIRWFFTKNPLLGDIAPIEMVILGKELKLLHFVMEQRAS